MYGNKYARKLIRKVRHNLVDGPNADRGRELTDALESALNRGLPAEVMGKAINELRKISDQIDREIIKHNTRVNFGNMLSQLSEFKASVERINEEISDPEMREYFIDIISHGETYDCRFALSEVSKPRLPVTSRPITADVVGIKHSGRPAVIQKLRIGESVILRREPENRKDSIDVVYRFCVGSCRKEFDTA